MRTRYSVDGDSRMIVLRYVRKYDEYRRWYNDARDDILLRGRRHSEAGGGKGLPGDTTFDKTELLLKLDDCHRSKVLRAINDARLKLSCVFPSEAEGKKLEKAIFESCRDSRESNFEAYAGLIACERTAFYEYKSRFIKDIKEAIGI